MSSGEITPKLEKILKIKLKIKMCKWIFNLPTSELLGKVYCCRTIFLFSGEGGPGCGLQGNEIIAINTYMNVFIEPCDNFQSHQMWDLMKFYVKTDYNIYDTLIGAGNWSEIVFTLVLRRKPLYHIFYLILPATIIGFIGIFSFIIPFDCEEKLNLPMTMLLSITVFMLAILTSTPETSVTIPLMSMDNFPNFFEML